MGFAIVVVVVAAAVGPMMMVGLGDHPTNPFWKIEETMISLVALKESSGPRIQHPVGGRRILLWMIIAIVIVVHHGRRRMMGR